MSDGDKPKHKVALLPQGLFLVFLHLKLSGGIDWNWWLIFLPIIIPVVSLGIMAGIGAAIDSWFESNADRERMARITNNPNPPSAEDAGWLASRIARLK